MAEFEERDRDSSMAEAEERDRDSSMAEVEERGRDSSKPTVLTVRVSETRIAIRWLDILI